MMGSMLHDFFCKMVFGCLVESVNAALEDDLTKLEKERAVRASAKADRWCFLVIVTWQAIFSSRSRRQVEIRFFVNWNIRRFGFISPVTL